MCTKSSIFNVAWNSRPIFSQKHHIHNSFQANPQETYLTHNRVGVVVTVIHSVFSVPSSPDCERCKLQRNMAGAGKAHRGNGPMARKQSQVDSTTNVEVYGLFVIVALLIVKEWPMLIPNSNHNSFSNFHRHTILYSGHLEEECTRLRSLESRHRILWASFSLYGSKLIFLKALCT